MEPDSIDLSSTETSITASWNSIGNSIVYEVELEQIGSSSFFQFITETRDSTIIIEYFMGKKYLYIFSISKENTNLVQVEIDSSMQQQIKLFRQSIVNRDRDIYSRLAFELYEILINPIKEINSIKKIIIIPDGILGYIPFEVLLTEKIEDNNSNYKNYPYLIKDYQISYSYSATLLIENNKIKEQEKDIDFVGFAPVYFK